jgi:hypothetical protein
MELLFPRLWVTNTTGFIQFLPDPEQFFLELMAIFS